MKNIKKNKSYIVTILIVALALFTLIRWLEKQAEYHESRCELEEIEGGIYAMYYQTVSTVPAHNYDVVEICVNGNMRTYKGYVSITYTDETPYVVIMQNNLVNDDKVFLYVQKGTVEHKESVGVR